MDPKEFKLIPLSLYNTLMRQRDAIPSVPPADNILDTNLPDDVKVSLFQEIKRNQNTRNKLERKKPILVKDVQQKPAEKQTEIKVSEPKYSRAQLKIVDFLKSINIVRNEKMRLI